MLWGLEVNHRATRNRYEHISNLKLMGTYYFNLLRVLLSNMGRDQLSLFSSLLLPFIYPMFVRKRVQEKIYFGASGQALKMKLRLSGA